MAKKKFCITISVLALCAVLAVVITVFTVVLPQKEAQEQERLAEQFNQFYTSKLVAYQAENERYSDYEVDVAFIGDSLTDLYDVQSYYPEFVVANRGISGDTTLLLEERLKVSVYDLKPKVVVMLIGANNMDTMFTNYENILIGLRDNLPETKVVILSLTAMGGNGWGKKNQLAAFNNVKIKKLAEEYDYYFIDLYSPLLDVHTGEVYEGYTIDGGHFTPKGYEVVTSLVKPTLAKILNDSAD